MKWIIGEKEAGLRLDVFLARHVEGLSRSAAARALDQGAVRVGGRINLKPGLALREGDEVEYTALAPVPADAAPEDLPLEILYQDQHLAVVNKPAGLVTHPAVGHKAGTLVNALLYHVPDLSGVGGALRPGIVHRLDKETSGLMLVAKHDRAHHLLSAAIQAREVEREYDAIVWGEVADEAFSVNARIGRDPHDRKRFTVVRTGGKEAVTHLEVVRRFGVCMLLRVRLETGRTHQIRVHCHYAGLPVVGDRMYGKRGEVGQLGKMGLERPGRQLLHAVRLRFFHPSSRRQMEFRTPWPHDFAVFVRNLEKAGYLNKR
ncbi:RluA family pseudouridine synthase [candidate division FCPU426 bacterium]|nr:RluA family pseudouridine synthase [candidate division FCPU426 bacterium]